MKKIIADKVKKNITDLIILFFLVFITSLPRVVSLDKIPPGLHGDEGWTGIDARKILKNGVIPPYVDSALGQPTGPLYLTAFIFRLFGDSIFSLRLSMTIFGIMTIPFFYIFLRIFFNKKISILSAIALNFSLIHLHYSRIAFMLISAPFFQLISLILFFYGRKTIKFIFFVLSAIFTGLGIYSYNTFILFPFPFFLFLIIDIIDKKSVYDIKKFLLFFFFFLVISLPLIKIIVTNPQFYFSHHQIYSVFNKPEIREAKQIKEKAKLILANGIENTKYFFTGGKIDYVDSFGKYRPFNKFYLILFVLGLLIAILEPKESSRFFLFSMSFLLLGNLLTFEGVYRRQILNLVNFFYFVAFFLNYIFEKFKEKYQIIIFFIFLFIVLSLSLKNLILYFKDFPNNPETKFVFTQDLTQTVLKLKTLYKTPLPVFFFSSRWNCHYETIRYIIPDLNCQDLSKEFGQTFVLPGCQQSFFVLLNNYLENIQMIKGECPYGEEIKVSDDKGNLLGIIYQVKSRR